jgi:hypothetical protein
MDKPVEFTHDPRRVMVAAYNRLMSRPPGKVPQPVRETQIRMLAAGIAAYDRMSPELSALHHTYRFALAVLNKERRAE